MTRDLCQINEVLLRRFFTGLIYEKLVEVTEDAEIFHVERVETEQKLVARTLCRPAAYSATGVESSDEGETD